MTELALFLALAIAVTVVSLALDSHERRASRERTRPVRDWRTR